MLIDFVANESNEHELAALDGCPLWSDGTGVRLSAQEIAPTMPGTASAHACSRRSPARSMRANGRAQASLLHVRCRSVDDHPDRRHGYTVHGSATIGVVEWGADVLGAGAESRQSGRDVAEQRDPK